VVVIERKLDCCDGEEEPEKIEATKEFVDKGEPKNCRYEKLHRIFVLRTLTRGI